MDPDPGQLNPDPNKKHATYFYSYSFSTNNEKIKGRQKRSNTAEVYRKQWQDGTRLGVFTTVQTDPDPNQNGNNP